MIPSISVGWFAFVAFAWITSYLDPNFTLAMSISLGVVWARTWIDESPTPAECMGYLALVLVGMFWYPEVCLWLIFFGLLPFMAVLIMICMDIAGYDWQVQ